MLLLLQVVKDVALTISQAIGPVEKGVGKIQEKFHHISLKPGDKKEPQVAVEEHVTENVASTLSGGERTLTSRRTSCRRPGAITTMQHRSEGFA
jgi:hypothetical protein